MSDTDYRDIWGIKNKHDRDKRAPFLFGITHPIPENNQCCQHWLREYPVFFSFFKQQKQLVVRSEKLTLTCSWNHSRLQRKGDGFASKKWMCFKNKKPALAWRGHPETKSGGSRISRGDLQRKSPGQNEGAGYLPGSCICRASSHFLIRLWLY